jgi:hypothetical protein
MSSVLPPMRRLTLGDLPGTWESSFAQLAMQSTVRINPKYALNLAQERTAGSTWGEPEPQDTGHGYDQHIDILGGIAALPWQEVNSRRQYDHLNESMLPDCTYLAVTQAELEEVFPDAKQNIWTLPYLLRKWHQDFTGEVFDTEYVRYDHIVRGMERDGFKVVPSVKTGKPEMQCKAVTPTFVRELWSPDDCYGAWLIIGPAEDENGDEVKGERMIWSIYPGNLTPRVPSDWDGQLMSLLPMPYYEEIEERPCYTLKDVKEYTVKGVS